MFGIIVSTGVLRYAGTLSHSFSPNSLKVDGRGYLYHPSPPTVSQRGFSRKVRSQVNHANPYGRYSLLRSELVIAQLSVGLDIAEDSCEGGYQWLGKTYSIGRLKEEEVTRGIWLNKAH